MRLNRRKQAKPRADFAWSVMLAIKAAGGSIPTTPFQRARITIVRRSVGHPDPDGLSAKRLLDVLQPLSARHPTGLGIIIDDSAKCLGPTGAEIRAVHVTSRREQGTDVLIEGET